MTLADYVSTQRGWSSRTFGTAKRTVGICNHIRKELLEIEANPDDLEEWIDVLILAMDGYWRHGGQPEDLLARLIAKQAKNFERQWPPIQPEDCATEHIREARPRSSAIGDVKC